MIKYLSKTLSFFGIFSLFLFFFSFPVAAANYDLEMPLLPSQAQPQTPGQFIKTFFTYGLGLVGIVALFAIIIGGAHYILSGGSESKKTEGKRWIWGAIGGLILLLFSYWLLRTIHPQFVSLQEPNLTQNISTGGGAEGGGLEIPLIGGQADSMPTPGQYIKTFFIFGLGLIGIIALFAIVYGGFVYFLSAGNQAMKTHGKQWIWAAISGLALSLLSFLILVTINPQLIGLNIKGLDKISIGDANNITGLNTRPENQAQENLRQIEYIIQNPEEFTDLVLQPEDCPTVSPASAIKNGGAVAGIFNFEFPGTLVSLAYAANDIPLNVVPFHPNIYTSQNISPEKAIEYANRFNKAISGGYTQEWQDDFKSKWLVFLTPEEYETVAKKHLLVWEVENINEMLEENEISSDMAKFLMAKAEYEINNEEELSGGLYCTHTIIIRASPNLDVGDNFEHMIHHEFGGHGTALKEGIPIAFMDAYSDSWNYYESMTQDPVNYMHPSYGFASRYGMTNAGEGYSDDMSFYQRYEGNYTLIQDPRTRQLYYERFKAIAESGYVKPLGPFVPKPEF